jgi:hypothetical protein
MLNEIASPRKGRGSQVLVGTIDRLIHYNLKAKQKTSLLTNKNQQLWNSQGKNF